MNNRYLIAIDLDGTLLTNKKKISLRSKIYIKKLSKQGHLIVLSSGRPKRALLHYYKKLKLKTPVICYNGTYIYSPCDPNFPVTQKFIDRNIAISLCNDYKSILKNFCCETNEDMWFLKEDKYLTSFFWDKGMNLHYGNIEDILKEDPMTMIVQCSDKVDNLDQNKIQSIAQKYDGLDVRFWYGGPYFEVTYAGASKGCAIKMIADYYHIDDEHIIAFGDAENDISMLQSVKHPFIMKNGINSSEVKNIQRTKYSNNDNGVIYALKEFFENN